MSFLGMDFGLSPGFSMGFPFGMRVISDPNCLEETDERMFPVSRHRSARVRKKLLRRFGGEFRKQPAMFKIGQTIICHPAMYAKLKAQIRSASA